jgi:hypothetical protein
MFRYHLLCKILEPHTGPRWSFTTAENISRFGTQIKLSRFANLVRRNYILLINTSLYMCALSWLLIGLCWCNCVWYYSAVFLLTIYSLKWQYNSIGPQIMTNFVKIGTKESLQSGETECSFNWLLILDTFAHQTCSSFSSSCSQKAVGGKPLPIAV